MEECFLQIEPLDHQTVKIILSERDMRQFGLTYESMDYNDSTTRKVILDLLQQVHQATQIDMSQGKLFIEAFPDETGGCILYLNLLAPGPSSPLSNDSPCSPIAIFLPSLDQLTGVCKLLNTRHKHSILKSSLYRSSRQYLLILYPCSKNVGRLCAAIHEFNASTAKGYIVAGSIHERNKLLIKNKAIETVSAFL